MFEVSELLTFSDGHDKNDRNTMDGPGTCVPLRMEHSVRCRLLVSLYESHDSPSLTKVVVEDLHLDGCYNLEDVHTAALGDSPSLKQAVVEGHHVYEDC